MTEMVVGFPYSMFGVRCSGFGVRGREDEIEGKPGRDGPPEAGVPMMDLSVIIPTYNEEPNIRRSAEGVISFLRGRDATWELLLVDDGSRDGTLAIEQEIARGEPRVRVLAHSPNRGKGYAVREGMLAAQGRLRLFLDADYSTPIEEWEKLRPWLETDESVEEWGSESVKNQEEPGTAYAPTLSPSHAPTGVSPLRGGFDVAIGTRRVANALIETKPPIHRYLLGELYVWLTSKLLGCHVSDYNCGFKAFRAEAADRLFRLQRRNDWSFDAEVLALAERLGYRIKEVPVRWAHAQATSKVKPIRDGIRSFLALLRISRDLKRGKYGKLGV